MIYQRCLVVIGLFAFSLAACSSKTGAGKSGSLTAGAFAGSHQSAPGNSSSANPVRVVSDQTQSGSSDRDEDFDAQPAPNKKGIVAEPVVPDDGGGEVVSSPAAGPGQPPIASAQPAARGQECGQAYYATDPDWFPGLPFEKGTPQFTGGADRLNHASDEVRKNPTLGLQYTDSARDSLMAAAIARADARSQAKQKWDRELALLISAVRVSTDIRTTGHVDVTFSYRYAPGQFAKVTLAGKFTNRGPKGRQKIQLTQTDSEIDGEFAGRLSCMDENGDCENTLIEIALLNPDTNQPGRIVQVVHRWGNAQVTMADQDRVDYARTATGDHRVFAEYLSHTANNTCLANIAAQKQNPTLSACALQTLTKLCGSAKAQFPSARLFSLRTYAVAYGRAGFEFIAVDREATGGGAQAQHFLISGPLGISSGRPMVPTKLKVESQIPVYRANLIANDGVGDINLQIEFGKHGEEFSRLNITALFQPTKSDAAPTNPDGTPSWVK